MPLNLATRITAEPRDSVGGSSVLTLLSVTCLDAPFVALGWQELLGRAAHINLTLAQRAALFATAWLIYLADRFADSFTIAANAPSSLRQKFVRAHRRAFSAAMVIAVVIDAAVVPQLEPQIVAAGALVAAICIVYLGLNQFFGGIWRMLPLKEITIGILFAAGVYSSLGLERIVSFGIGPVLFALLCALNCISIAFWERPLDLVQNRSSIATVFPEVARLPLLCCAVLALAAVFLALRDPRPSLSACVGASAVLLALLNTRTSTCLTTDARTALADIVLFTPWLALLFAG